MEQRVCSFCGQPIEPGSGSVGLRIALVVAMGLAIGLAFWFWANAH